AILDAQLNTVPKSPIELNPSLPKAVNDIIMTAMAKEPMHRFQSAEAFRNALESVRGRSAAAPAGANVVSPSQAQTITAPKVSGQKSRRGLWMAAGAVACVCVLAGAAVMLPHFWKSSAASKPTAPVERASVTTPPPPEVASSAPATPTAVPTTPAATPANQVDSGSVPSVSDGSAKPVVPAHKPVTKAAPHELAAPSTLSTTSAV